jgi:hypothetical protein
MKKKKTAPKQMASTKALTPGGALWLQDQFKKINTKLNLILDSIEDLESEILGEGNVIPELEQAINRVVTRAVSIDRKVKD